MISSYGAFQGIVQPIIVKEILTSVEQLKERIDAFIERYNENAEPFVWTNRKSTSAVSKAAVSATCDSGY